MPGVLMGEDRKKCEEVVQRKLANFCTYLPEHLRQWRAALKDYAAPVEMVHNLGYQLRYLERRASNLVDPELEGIQYGILRGIEDALMLIKDLMERLTTSNNELKSKLTALEASTRVLDFDHETPLIKGTATQPPLEFILQQGLCFLTFFTNAYCTMAQRIKDLDVRNKESVGDMKAAFDVALDGFALQRLIALTQYVGREEHVV